MLEDRSDSQVHGSIGAAMAEIELENGNATHTDSTVCEQDAMGNNCTSLQNSTMGSFFEKGPYAKFTDKLWMFGTPLIILVGTFGNLLTVIIILRQVKKITSTAVFLLALASSDTVILFCGPVRQWVLSVWSYDLREISVAGCKTSLFLTYSTIQISSWLLVAVTIERVVSVLWPHKVKMGCTRKTSIITVLIIAVSIFILNTHFVYGTGMSALPYYPNSFCDPMFEDYHRFRQNVWIWIDLAIAFAVPFTLLVLCNVIIIYKLNANRLRRRSMAIVQTKRSKAMEKETLMITLTLILLSVVFFICVTPSAIYFIYLAFDTQTLTDLWYTNRAEFNAQIDRLVLLHCVCSIMSYINAMFNFLLYVVTGSRFRREITALLCCRRPERGAVFSVDDNTRKSQDPSTTLTPATSGPSVFSTECNEEPIVGK